MKKSKLNSKVTKKLFKTDPKPVPDKELSKLDTFDDVNGGFGSWLRYDIWRFLAVFQRFYERYKDQVDEGLGISSIDIKIRAWLALSTFADKRSYYVVQHLKELFEMLSTDGLENMKLFVIANSIVVLTTLVYPHIHIVFDIISDAFSGPDALF